MKRIAIAGLLLTAFVQATVGEPLSGTSVGLEGDPGSRVATALTDARGEVAFTVGPGRYSVFLADASGRAAIITVTPVNDAPQMVSAPITPRRGRAYAADTTGRRLVTVVPRGGGRIRIRLSEATVAVGDVNSDGVPDVAIPSPRQDTPR